MPNLNDDGLTIYTQGGVWDYKDFYISWDTLKDGKNTAISIVEQQLTGGPEDNPPTLTLVKEHEAESTDLYFRSIPSEVLRTIHEVPQINMKIGDFYAVCKGNCDMSIIPLT